MDAAEVPAVPEVPAAAAVGAEGAAPVQAADPNAIEHEGIANADGPQAAQPPHGGAAQLAEPMA